MLCQLPKFWNQRLCELEHVGRVLDIHSHRHRSQGWAVQCQDTFNRDFTTRDADNETNAWEQWAFCWAAGLAQREIEPATWKAFWLTAVEGVAANEAASRLSMKVGSVYTAKCRTMARIRQLVAELSRSEQ